MQCVLSPTARQHSGCPLAGLLRRSFLPGLRRALHDCRTPAEVACSTPTRPLPVFKDP
jgi:hypothetical protein